MIGDVEVREAGSKGRGVYARRAFGEGEFICRRRHIRILTTTGARDEFRVEVESQEL